MTERITRSKSDRILGGVCGGLGEHFDIDPTLIRLGFVAALLFGGSGPILYLIAWLIIPTEGEAGEEISEAEPVEERFSETDEEQSEKD
jgi:Putative stress-responsive transcriptional regulator|nr:MAG: putative stress-responsive transcriptional regulator [Candidatus Nanosalinarum sp. J07AB56]